MTKKDHFRSSIDDVDGNDAEPDDDWEIIEATEYLKLNDLIGRVYNDLIT